MWKAKSTSNSVFPPVWEGKVSPKPKNLLEPDLIGQRLFLSGLSSSLPSFWVGDVSHFPQRKVVKKRTFLYRNKCTNLDSYLSDYNTTCLLFKWHFCKNKKQKWNPKARNNKKMQDNDSSSSQSWVHTAGADLLVDFYRYPESGKKCKADPKVPRTVLYEQRGRGKWSLVMLAPTNHHRS